MLIIYLNNITLRIKYFVVFTYFVEGHRIKDFL